MVDDCELKLEKKELIGLSAIFTLVGISLASRCLIVLHTDTVLGVDAYGYIYQAKQFSGFDFYSYERGYVFTLILRASFALSQDYVLTSRLITILLSVLLVVVFFLVGKKFLGSRVAFIAALFVSFETQFLIYSTIPYTEIFLSLLVFVAFYASTNSRRLVRYVLFPFALGLATLTRIEAYLLLMPSIVVFIRTETMERNRTKLVTSLSLLLYIGIPLLAFAIFPQIVIQYYSARTRFDPLERAVIFLQPRLLQTILELTFNVFSDSVLNFLFLLSVILGILFAIVGSVYTRRKKLISMLMSHNLLPFSLFLFFCLYTVFITMYAPWGIRIVGSHITVIGNPPSQRYLIITKLLLFYPSAYVIYRFVKFQVDGLYRRYSVSDTWNLRLKEIKIRIPSKTAGVVLIFTCLLVSSSYIMFRDALESASVKDEVMKTLTLSGDWLSQNLKNDELAIVPLPEVFGVENPDLEPRMIPYETFWDLAGVQYRADLANHEVLQVWTELLEFISANNVKYLVRDWIEPYCGLIFQVAATQLDSITTLVNEERFTLPDGYSAGVRIYEIEEGKDVEILLRGSFLEISFLADGGSNYTLIDNSRGWTPNSLVGLRIKMAQGTNVGTVRKIISNTRNVITIEEAWSAPPDNTSRYLILVDDADRLDLQAQVWSVSEGSGITIPTRDNVEGLANIYAAAQQDAEKFGIQYDLGASGFNASSFEYLVVPAKISTVRSADGIYLVDTFGNSRKWDCSLSTDWTLFVLPLDRYDSEDLGFNISAIRYVKVDQRDILKYDRISVDAFWFDTDFHISRAEATTNWSIISGGIVAFAEDSERQEGMSSIKCEVVSDPDGFIRIVYDARDILDFNKVSHMSFWLRVDKPTNITTSHISLRDPSNRDRSFDFNIRQAAENVWTLYEFDLSMFDRQTAGFEIDNIVQLRFVLTVAPETPLTLWIDNVKAN